MKKAIKYFDILRICYKKYRQTDTTWRAIKRFSKTKHDEKNQTSYHFKDESVLILTRIDKNNMKYVARDLETKLENVFMLTAFNLGE